MSTHTPGPWTWYWQRDRDGYADGRIGTDPKSNTLGMSVCVAVSPRLVDQPQWEADARLIALAPELLEYVESSASAGCATAQSLIARLLTAGHRPTDPHSPGSQRGGE